MTMTVQELEEVIALAQGHGPRKFEASTYLDQVRVSQDRWQIGLSLFFEGSNAVSKFFGLSLIRDFLSTPAAQSSSPQVKPVRAQIRELVLRWVEMVVRGNETVEPYIQNNVVAIVALLVKADYPQDWAAPFDFLLSMGRASIAGLTIVVGILEELETEVVVYNETRTRDEIQHNTLIKDSMRGSNVTREIVQFLCESVASAISINAAGVANKCLTCLASQVGWIDVKLVIQSNTISMVYSCLKDQRVNGMACSCLFELVKKGMDSASKIAVMKSIGLVEVLQTIPYASECDKDDAEGCAEEFGQLVDMVFLELLGAWSEYEDILLGGSGGKDSGADSNGGASANNENCPNSSATQGHGPEAVCSLESVVPEVLRSLEAVWPIVLAIFAHTDSDVSCSVLPSLSRVTALMKTQLAREAQVKRVAASMPGYFLAQSLLQGMLLGILRQSQHAEDFTFDPMDEDDAAAIEAKKDVRKLFVNCCRVVPQACLDLIGYALQSLPQPLSSAPFPQLEATLRLVYAFSECGVKHNALVKEGVFPALVCALHSTDVAHHPHPQVLLAYYEAAVRYSRLPSVELGTVQHLVALLSGERGVTHGNAQVRSRAAYFLYRLCEQMEGRASVLLPSLNISVVAAPDPASSRPLSEGAELHLFEALGLMTSSQHVNVEVGVAFATFSSADQQKTVQSEVLARLASGLVGQIEALARHPQWARYSEEMSPMVAHRVNCLSSLAKGHHYQRSHAEIVATFEQVATTMVKLITGASDGPAVNICAYSCVREKILVLLHRSMTFLRHAVLSLVGVAYGRLVAQSDSSDTESTLQLLNQAMVEFQGEACSLVGEQFGPVLEKLRLMKLAFEQQCLPEAGAGDTEKAPHVDCELAALQRQFLVFLQHVVSQGCADALIMSQNAQYVEYCLAATLAALKGAALADSGGRERLLPAAINIPLRKHALAIVASLAKVWDWAPSANGAYASAPGGPEQETCPKNGGDVNKLSPEQRRQLASLFSAYLLHEAVPEAMRLCAEAFGRQHGGDGSTNSNTGSRDAPASRLNCRDAQANTVFGDVGALLHAMHAVNAAVTLQYLRESPLLTSLGWSVAGVNELCQSLSHSAPVGTFREAFKKLLKAIYVHEG